jgi:hypothetical protein
MDEINFLDWKILADIERTRLAYESIVGTTASCNCHWCSNFVAGRDESYPSEVLHLLAQIGIDHRKEADLYQQARFESEKAILYRWWFYFIGEIVTGPRAWEFIPNMEGEDRRVSYWRKHLVTLREEPLSFLIGFSDDAKRREQGEETFVPDELKPFDLVQVEFNAVIPWVLPTELPQL